MPCPFSVSSEKCQSQTRRYSLFRRAYSRKNFYDLAIEQFNLLKSEIQIMDERKKEAIYELGCCYESMEKGEEAMEEFKLVYSADISFRDVAEKINAFYNNK